ncbi:hypothetical protein P7M09_27500, partial [Vibrio parahaemolyticus]|nr:hypothetical protein [Vibrio parahaemolyticus]
NQLFRPLKSTTNNYQPTGRNRGRPKHKDKIYPYWLDGHRPEIAAQKLGYPLEKVQHYYHELEKEHKQNA